MQLETTLLTTANNLLLEIEAEAKEYPEITDIHSRFSELSSITGLAYLADSGLSEPTCKELELIYNTALSIMQKAPPAAQKVPADIAYLETAKILAKEAKITVEEHCIGADKWSNTGEIVAKSMLNQLAGIQALLVRSGFAHTTACYDVNAELRSINEKLRSRTAA